MRKVNFGMTSRFLLTAFGNGLLLMLLAKGSGWLEKMRYAQWATIITTITMAMAQQYPHTPAGNYAYDSWWMCCDIADAAVEICILILVIGATTWDGEEFLKPLLVIGMFLHLDIKLQEWGVRDIFMLHNWDAYLNTRQWLNLALIYGMCVMVYREHMRNRALRSISHGL